MTAPVVAGRYALHSPVPARSGPHAETWQARDLEQDRDVVLTLLPGGDAAAHRAFADAAPLLRDLRLPGLAPVLDVGQSEDGVSAWVVREPVPGRVLADVLSEGLPEQRARALVAAVARTAAAARVAGVPPGPLTPSEVLLRPDGTPVLLGVGLPGSDDDVAALGGLLQALLPPAGATATRALAGRWARSGTPGRPADAAAAAALLARRPGRRRLLLQAAAALVLAVGVGTAVHGLRASPGPPVTVPDVRPGSSALEVQRVLVDAGLRPRWRDEVDGDVPEGRVVRTVPPSGATLHRGSRVTVITSGQPVVGLPYATARRVLARRGVTVRPVLDGSGGPPGTVRRLEPDGPLVPGEEVLVHVVPGGEGER